MHKTHLASLLSALLAAGPVCAATHDPDTCRVVLPEKTEVANETVEWKGPCVNGYAEGEGVLLRFLKREQIASFEGRLAQGMMAEGYEKTPDGEQYEGQYKNGLRDGKGTWISDRGDRYDGEWRAGKRHGWGVASFELGGRYEGPWSNNQPSGKGTISYAGGKREERDAAFPSRPPTPEDDSAPRKYRVKQTERDNFFRFPNDVVSSRFVPFDKSFTQMTAEEQARIRKIYPLLHDNDVPPYPEKGTAQIYRWLKQAQGALLVEGELRMAVDVDAKGKATAVTVYESPDTKMAELMKVIFFSQKFSPALCDGTPCAMRYPFNVHFTTGASGYH